MPKSGGDKQSDTNSEHNHSDFSPRNDLHILYHNLRLDKLYTISNRRAIGEHTSTAVNCIPPAEVALHLAVGDFERNGYIYGHWGGMGVSSEENESE